MILVCGSMGVFENRCCCRGPWLLLTDLQTISVTRFSFLIILLTFRRINDLLLTHNLNRDLEWKPFSMLISFQTIPRKTPKTVQTLRRKFLKVPIKGYRVHVSQGCALPGGSPSSACAHLGISPNYMVSDRFIFYSY